MAEKKITVREAFALQEELKAVSAQKLKIKVKYKLLPLKQAVNAIVDEANKAKDDLILKYGENGELKQFSNEETMEINPQFQEFFNEWVKELAEEIDLKYEPIDIKLLEDVETEQNIEVLFSLVD